MGVRVVAPEKGGAKPEGGGCCPPRDIHWSVGAALKAAPGGGGGAGCESVKNGVKGFSGRPLHIQPSSPRGARSSVHVRCAGGRYACRTKWVGTASRMGNKRRRRAEAGETAQRSHTETSSGRISSLFKWSFLRAFPPLGAVVEGGVGNGSNGGLDERGVGGESGGKGAGRRGGARGRCGGG
ncbi:hypothetical protein C8F04DRAFT_1166545 [Mycena alexandri]|uniref:Uncharacterized protein n=1 Tax=Mycena alexandri TaxID=1745969 RepID=A0AAD6RVK2_9AGAR|nr:hypothetical protein C8F04DRAFT_1166545 [Mycena alexandri]